MGFMFGATWTITRAVMSALSPRKTLNYGFSFYTLAERVATLVGPLSWGLITLFLVNLGAVRYRISLVSMAVFVALGLYIVRKIEIKHPVW